MGQTIIIILGVILILSSIDTTSIFKYLKPQISTKPNIAAAKKDDLVSIVGKWSDLKTICENNGLTEAVSKLDEIFPTLIKVDK